MHGGVGGGVGGGGSGDARSEFTTQNARPPRVCVAGSPNMFHVKLLLTHIRYSATPRRAKNTPPLAFLCRSFTVAATLGDKYGPHLIFLMRVRARAVEAAADVGIFAQQRP